MGMLFRSLMAASAVSSGPAFVGAASVIDLPADGVAVVTDLSAEIPGIRNGDYVLGALVSDALRGNELIFNSGAGLLGAPTTLPSVVDDTTSPGHTIVEWTYSSATPSISITNPASGLAADRGIFLVAVFRSVLSPTASDVTVASGSTISPDPPGLGSVEVGSIVLGVGFLDDDALVTSTAPTGFTMAVQGNVPISSGNSGTASVVYAVATSTSVNPGRISGGNDAWYAYTIELRAA